VRLEAAKHIYRSLALKAAIAKDLPDKLDQLVPFLRSRTGPAIVYVTLQQHAVDVAAALKARDPSLNAMVYHAGLPSEERERIQNEFMESEQGIVCATIAFGMGIDKGTLLPP
jgi:superfamily II DNA helicase RecQ